MSGDVVLVGGGKWQVFLLDFLKRKGHTVHIVNPVRSATVERADHHLEADVKDTERILACLRRIGPRFVTSDQSDVCTLPVARLSAAMGLPGNPVGVVSTFVDKARMYRHARSQGLPVPDHAEVTAADGVERFIEAHGLPVVLKPVDATASRGFTVIDADSRREIPKRLERCLAFSLRRTALVQERVDGREVTVEGICSGGRHRTLTMSAKRHFRPGITSCLSYPADLASETLSEVAALTDRFVEASGLRFGITHAEYMIDAAGPHLLEIAARGGGLGISSEVVPWVTGVPVYEILYRALNGESVDVGSLRPLRRPAHIQVFEFAPAVAARVPVEEIRATPGVHLFMHDFHVDDYSYSDDVRQSLAMLRAETPEALAASLARVRRLFAEQGARWE